MPEHFSENFSGTKSDISDISSFGKIFQDSPNDDHEKVNSYVVKGDIGDGQKQKDEMVIILDFLDIGGTILHHVKT